METVENQNQNPQNQPSTAKAAGLFVLDLVKILAIAIIIIWPFRTFVAEPFVVSGSSMLPNFHNGDYLIVDRLSYHFSPPKRGDVIVLRNPKNTSEFFIKRVIGLPGDRVAFDDQGSVYIYDKQDPQGLKLKETYLPEHTETLGKSMPQDKVLGSEEFYVLGDNRTGSSDSRVWGILPQNDIVGRVWVRVFPISAAKAFHTPSYQ